MSMAMNQAKLMQQAQLALMNNVMDFAEIHTEAFIEMINDSVPHPYLGKGIDLKV